MEGLLCQTIFYTADLDDQPVHSAHFSIPFSAYIVVPGNTSLDQRFDVIICIEDLFVKECCPRQIFKNVTLLLQAKPFQNIECPNEC